MKKECTVKELCEMYNITRTTVERLRKQGLPFLKRNRNVYFVVEDVDEWMENRYKTKKYNYEEKNLSD